MYYLVEYDLIDNKNYEKVIAEIKNYPTWAKFLRSSWFIKSEENASAIRDHLKSFMDNDDKLIVMELSDKRNWATSNISKDVTDWMQSNI